MSVVTQSQSTKGDELEKVIFTCSNCSMCEQVDYQGTKPPFSKDLMVKETAYIMKDPFSDPNEKQALIIGNDCSVCDKMICLDKECSVFYKKPYCLQCAKDNPDVFPASLRVKFK